MASNTPSGFRLMGPAGVVCGTSYPRTEVSGYPIDDNEAHYLQSARVTKSLAVSSSLRTCFGRRERLPSLRIEWLEELCATTMFSFMESFLDRLQGSSRSLYGREGQEAAYKNPDNDVRGPWVSTDFTAQGWRPNQMYAITTPSGAVYEPPPQRCWGNVEAEFEKLKGDGRIWFGVNGDARPRIKNFLSEVGGMSTWTWWPNDEVGHNQEAKKESNELFGAARAFATPKPERLLKRVIEVSTEGLRLGTRLHLPDAEQLVQ